MLQVQVVIQAIIAKAECSNKRGLRYSAAWFFECLLLRIKSPKAYEHLKDRNLLFLPDKSTVNRSIRRIPGKYGLNDYSDGVVGVGRDVRKKSSEVHETKNEVRRLCRLWGRFNFRESDKLADHALLFFAHITTSGYSQLECMQQVGSYCGSPSQTDNSSYRCTSQGGSCCDKCSVRWQSNEQISIQSIWRFWKVGRCCQLH